MSSQLRLNPTSRGIISVPPFELSGLAYCGVIAYPGCERRVSCLYRPGSAFSPSAFAKIMMRGAFASFLSTSPTVPAAKPDGCSDLKPLNCETGGCKAQRAGAGPSRLQSQNSKADGDPPPPTPWPGHQSPEPEPAASVALVSGPAAPNAQQH